METVIPIVLIVNFEIDSDALKLHYSAENKTDKEVYLVNRMTEYVPEKGYIPNPKVVYVLFHEGGRVEICKRVPPVPVRLVTPRNYHVTPLPPGKKFEEDLCLPLPLKENRPYDSFIDDLPEAKVIEAKVEFVLGVFPSHRLLMAKPVEVHGVPAFDLVRNPDAPPPPSAEEAPPAEILIRSPVWQSKLPVIELPLEVKSR